MTILTWRGGLRLTIAAASIIAALAGGQTLSADLAFAFFVTVVGVVQLRVPLDGVGHEEKILSWDDNQLVTWWKDLEAEEVENSQQGH